LSEIIREKDLGILKYLYYNFMKYQFRFNFRKYLFLLISIQISGLLSAQVQNNKSLNAVQELLLYSQNYYGIDDELINGCVYQMHDYRIQGNPYLLEDVWSSGTIFVKGKEYPNLLLKYDVLTNEIVLNIQINEYKRLLSVNKSQIDSFLIEDRLFVSSRILLINLEEPTFYEKINNNEYCLLVKYKKVFLKTYNNLSPNGRFSSLKKDIILFHNGVLESANTANLLIKGFGNLDKKKVKNYIKQNGINYSNASSRELKELITYCNTITFAKNEN